MHRCQNNLLGCGGLDEECLPLAQALKTWSPVDDPVWGGGAASQEDALIGREHLRVHSQATPAVTLSAPFLSAEV